MLDEFIQSKLAAIDDLTELKVSIVAVRLLDQKQNESASISASELQQLDSLKEGLGFAPELALESALKRAVMRGTLLVCSVPSLDEHRYFLNTPAGRSAIDAIELAEQHYGSAAVKPVTGGISDTVNRISREIERLEMVEAYPVAQDDLALIEEWLARGYSSDEILQQVRQFFIKPRPKGTAVRTLRQSDVVVTAQPPAQPSSYYKSIITHASQVPDVAVAFRECAHRLPDGHAFQLLQVAVGMFGSTAVIQMMQQMLSTKAGAIDDLIPMLSEKQEAELENARAQAAPDALLHELLQLYESVFGIPPTSRIAQEIATMATEIKDVTTWQSVFQYASVQNKRNWEYIRKVLRNPAPSVFEPQPVNELAQYAFNEYKRRAGHGVLDPFVANEINALALQVTDRARWELAFNEAAAQNALRWSYLKSVISNSQPSGAVEGKNGRRKQTTSTRQRGVSRRPQVEEYTEAERESARERARQRIAERAGRGASRDKPDNAATG